MKKLMKNGKVKNEFDSIFVCGFNLNETLFIHSGYGISWIQLSNVFEFIVIHTDSNIFKCI